MVYMGSKRRYCKDIVPIIQKYIDENNITMFIDVFVGGSNLLDKIYCDNLVGNDLSPSLIALHQKAQTDFDAIPTDGTREYWDQAYRDWKIIRDAVQGHYDGSEVTMDLYKIGAIEWYGSFSNGGFPRGYAKPSATRNPYQEAYRNHKKQAENENYKKIKFIQGDYKFIFDKVDVIGQNVLLYCDSPYKGTKPYGIEPHFNFEEYYNWLRETSKLYPIFVSEQAMPEDFPIVWAKDDAKRTCGADNNFKACERLYLLKNS